MKSTAIWILVAGVIGVDGGALRIDAGRSAGLRVGDTAEIFYELRVRDETRRVDVGGARVISVSQESAALEVPGAVDARLGYRVEFSLPVDRLAGLPSGASSSQTVPDESARQLEAANRKIDALERERDDLEAERARAAARVEKLEATSQEREAAPSTADAEARAALRKAEERARTLEEALATAQTRERRSAEEHAKALAHSQSRITALESQHAEALATAQATRALLESELSDAQGALKAAKTLEIEPPSAVAEVEMDEPDEAPQVPVESTEVAETAPPEPDEAPVAPVAPMAPMAPADPYEGMARLSAGRYALGLPVSEARFYNQTPRFTRQLRDFRIDSEPVSAAAYDGSGDSTAKTGITFAEAFSHCRSVGKRLPTETEWEAAMTQMDLTPVPDLLEWTASWYQAYPGNDRVETDYGQRFRMIRASTGSRRERRYMLPEARDTSVGFRCAATTIDDR